jgi:aspartate aminotransferase
MGVFCFFLRGASTSKAAAIIFVDCRETLGKRAPDGTKIASDRDFCEYLLQDAAVAVMPGSAYGRSPYFRLSYVAADRELEAACYRIQEACAALI